MIGNIVAAHLNAAAAPPVSSSHAMKLFSVSSAEDEDELHSEEETEESKSKLRTSLMFH